MKYGSLPTTPVIAFVGHTLAHNEHFLHLFGSIVFVGFIFYIFNYIRVSSLDEFIYIFLVLHSNNNAISFIII